jgi:uncharacterized protein (TIGR00159 family)
VTDLIANLQSSVRLIDLLDIAIVAFIVYRILLLIRGTRAMQMLTGLGILALGFFSQQVSSCSQRIGCSHTFFDYLILIVIVLFQDDLRRALTHVGKNPFFAGSSDEEERQMVDEIVRSAIRLAKEKIGALLVIERETGLKNFIDTGSKLDARVKAELLYSIFVPTSPIHDGAVIITNGRLAAAGCFLPLSKDPNIDKKYGTRHRAALGLTEDTDAIVILISEEAGEAHLVKNGKITVNLSEQELRQSLVALLDIERNQINVPRRMRSWIQAVKERGRGGGK